VQNDKKTLNWKFTIEEMKAHTKPIIDPDTQEVLKIKYDDLETLLEEEATKLVQKESRF